MAKIQLPFNTQYYKIFSLLELPNYHSEGKYLVIQINLHIDVIGVIFFGTDIITANIHCLHARMNYTTNDMTDSRMTCGNIFSEIDPWL